MVGLQYKHIFVKCFKKKFFIKRNQNESNTWFKRGDNLSVYKEKNYAQVNRDSKFYHRAHQDFTEVAEKICEYGHTENQLATIVIGCAIEVHRRLGPGLLESAYSKCLLFELYKKGLNVESEKALPLFYKEVKMEVGYRLDMLVENKLIIEIKSVEAINEMHIAQCLTYLKVSNRKLALLINFNTVILKNGIRRLILGQLS